MDGADVVVAAGCGEFEEGVVAARHDVGLGGGVEGDVVADAAAVGPLDGVADLDADTVRSELLVVRLLDRRGRRAAGRGRHPSPAADATSATGPRVRRWPVATRREQ